MCLKLCEKNKTKKDKTEHIDPDQPHPPSFQATLIDPTQKPDQDFCLCAGAVCAFRIDCARISPPSSIVYTTTPTQQDFVFSAEGYFTDVQQDHRSLFYAVRLHAQLPNHDA